jgi:MFS family permease
MRTAFKSLGVRNFRLYFLGQSISAPGTWLQLVAEGWLVLQLTGSGVALGLVGSLQYGPMLLGGAWAGVLADRMDKRRVVIVTQLIKAALAAVLGLLVVTGTVQIWMVYAVALIEGLVNVIDNTARRSFVMELAGREHIANAVSLTGALWTTARITGPAVGGLLIGAVGVGPCFLLNALSYAGVLVALSLLRVDELHTGERVARGPRQVREGLAYVRRNGDLLRPLLLMAVAGLVAYNFRVVLPLLATDVFDQGAAVFGLLYSAMSVGSLAGALYTAARHRADERFTAAAALAMGVLIVATASAPTLLMAMAGLVLVGASSASFSATTQATLQLRSEERFRGRVLALYSVVFLGTTPLGSPLVGWLAETLGIRQAFAMAGAVTGACAFIALVVARRSPSSPDLPGAGEPDPAVARSGSGLTA